MMLRGLLIITLFVLAGCVSGPSTRYYGGDGDYYYGSGSAGVVIDSYGYGGSFGYGSYGPSYGWGYGLGYGGGYYSPWYGGWGYGLGYSPWPYPQAGQQQSPRRVDPGLSGRHGERLQAAPQRYEGRGQPSYPRAGDRQRIERGSPAARPPGVLRAPPARSAPPERLMQGDMRGSGRDGFAPNRLQSNPTEGMRRAPRATNPTFAPQRMAPSRVAPPPRESTRSE